MNAHLSRSTFSAIIPFLIANAVAACSDRLEPSRTAGVGAPSASNQSDRVYPDERRAVDLARQIPGLAGFYFDTSGNLVVTLKGALGSEAARNPLRARFQKELSRSRVRNPRADILVGGATYSFLELKEWRDRLMDGDILTARGVVWLDLDEVQNRVVIGLDVGVDPAALAVITHDLGIPLEAVEFERSGRLVPEQTLRDAFRPIEGGILIQRVSGGSRVGCTLGFTALWNNQQVFLTAGHCSPNLTGTDSVAQFQPLAPLTHADSATMSPIGREILQYSEPCGNRRCSYSDAAIYGLIPSQTWGLGRIARPTSGCALGPCNPPILTVTSSGWVIDTTRESFVVNDLVSKIGASTGWSQGFVQRTCVNVSPVNGVQYNCQMFASYGSDDGDSGSPVLLDIGDASDSLVTLGGIHSGRSGHNAVFSPWSGIVRDYGSLVVRAAPQDTTRPPVPDSFVLPNDSTRSFLSPFGSDERYYRDIVGVMFYDTTSGGTIRTTLAKYQASIIAGGLAFPYPVYYLQLPDPGGTSPSAMYAAIDSVARAINKEAGVFSTHVPQWRGLVRIRSRYPNDGPTSRRADWSSPTDATRALLAIRAPLAWGCETGAYGQTVRVAIIDRQFETHNDLVTQGIHLPVDSIRFRPTPPTIEELEHGNRVAGIFGATGDNDIGIAGVMWKSDLTLYALGARGGEAANPYLDFVHHLVHISDTLRTRILSMSATIGLPGDSSNVRWVVQALQIFFQRGGILVYAIGNDRNARPTISELRTTNDTAYSGLDKAVAILRDSLGFADNIITVGATDTAGAFLDSTTFWRGGTDILAPGLRILTLGLSNTTSIAPYGTSYATPYVTGVVAQLLTMDPSLTAAQVKDYILRGARQPRLNRQTGQIAPPQPVAGAPETVYQLDAYGALTLLARERSGIPLCGNRAWVSSQTVYAERDTVTHSLQQLAALGDTAAYVDVRHGGRRIEVSTRNSGDRAFELRQGQWVQTQDTATTPYGGAFLSLLQYSHDLDSTVGVSPRSGAGFVDLDVNITQFSPQTTTTVQTIHVPLPRSGSYMCFYGDAPLSECDSRDSIFTGTSTTADWRFAYSPQGDRVFVTVTLLVTQTTGTSYGPCPWPPPPSGSCLTASYRTSTDHTEVHEISLPTGADAVLWTVSDQQVYWLAGSEDGAQVVNGEGRMTQDYVIEPYPDQPGWRFRSQPQVITGCGIVYRVAASGGTQLHSVTSGDACLGDHGQGTMAPIRMSSR